MLRGWAYLGLAVVVVRGPRWGCLRRRLLGPRLRGRGGGVLRLLPLLGRLGRPGGLARLARLTRLRDAVLLVPLLLVGVRCAVPGDRTGRSATTETQTGPGDRLAVAAEQDRVEQAGEGCTEERGQDESRLLRPPCLSCGDLCRALPVNCP